MNTGFSILMGPHRAIYDACIATNGRPCGAILSFIRISVPTDQGPRIYDSSTIARRGECGAIPSETERRPAGRRLYFGASMQPSLALMIWVAVSNIRFVFLFPFQSGIQ